ncbi:MAG: DNA primase [Candidatus Omnitrophota bacterium]|nr:MAG: DNA primase [Candidatus Omnitrophota bacterium]
MASRYPENILDEILTRINIVEVIQDHIPLKRAGRNFKANCPFHHEKTPSFMVSPDKQIYHCFGCGESGNAFKFLMKYDRLDFPEAVRALAKKAGVVLPEIDAEDKRSGSLNTQLYNLNGLAVEYYSSLLNAKEAKNARQYFVNRGISKDSAFMFKLGYASDSWDGLSLYLRSKGFNLSVIEKAGLVIPRENGGYYDRFRNRVIFPILDNRERVVAFGARVLDNSLPKYINSPETPIYTKGKNLYGLHLSKDSIRENDYAVIVEGYLDFIMPYQHGFNNIVASLGTALTSEQVNLLKRYTHNAVMVFDPDTAGEIATMRSLDVFIESGMSVKIASLPKGYDPDNYVRKEGIEEFRAKIRSAESLFDYKLRMLRSRYGIKDLESKVKIATEMLFSINKVDNAVLRTEYVRQLADRLDFKEEALLSEMRKIKSEKGNSNSSLAVTKVASAGISPTEKLLLKLMLEEEELSRFIRENIEPEHFSSQSAARIISLMFELIDQGRSANVNTLANYLKDDSILEALCESVFLPDISDEEKEKVAQDCITKIKKERTMMKQQELHNKIKLAQSSGDHDKIKLLMQEFHQLIKTK